MFRSLFSSLRVLRLHRSLLAVAVIGFSFFAAGQTFAAEPTGEVHIEIPALHINAPVISIPLDQNIGTWNTARLGDSVGHFEYTPWLGESGNIVLGGHSTRPNGSPSIFYHLESVSIGDSIVVSQNGTTFEYVVSGVRYVDVSDVSVLYPAGGNTITLLTCAGFNQETEVFEQRLVVTGEPRP